MLSYSDCYHIIEKNLKALSFERHPEELYEPVRYTLSVGGKRIRPVLSLMAHALFNDDLDPVIMPAIGLEVFHNFTLLHDDIMDNASMRRNSPTVHVKWGQSTAILSGDAMLILAYQLIAKTDKKVLHEVLSVFNQTAMEVCEGQQLDMNYEKVSTLCVDDYLTMIRLKTAVLIAASLAIGGITSYAGDENINTLYQLGLNLGMAFQLQDDYLDVFANNRDFGKSVGGDILANKKTFLLTSALNVSNTDAKSELLKWMSKEYFDPEQKIRAVKQIYEDLNIPEMTRQRITEYHTKASDNLFTLKVSPDKKSELISFFNKIMSREH
jgi:geranylgeranyl diphosphate synthase, type II